jgi:hypothetical protein
MFGTYVPSTPVSEEFRALCSAVERAFFGLSQLNTLMVVPFEMVGLSGFEPLTSPLSGVRSKPTELQADIKTAGNFPLSCPYPGDQGMGKHDARILRAVLVFFALLVVFMWPESCLPRELPQGVPPFPVPQSPK